MSTTARAVEWHGHPIRPGMMPSVQCPFVIDWNTHEAVVAWLGVMHCNACPHVRKMHIDYQQQTGAVLCAYREEDHAET